VAEYLEALEIDDGFQSIAADYLADSREQIAKDWQRVREPDRVEHFLDDLSDSELNEKMLDRPLVQVRAELGIPEPIPGPHMFIL